MHFMGSLWHHFRAYVVILVLPKSLRDNDDHRVFINRANLRRGITASWFDRSGSLKFPRHIGTCVDMFELSVVLWFLCIALVIIIRQIAFTQGRVDWSLILIGLFSLVLAWIRFARIVRPELIVDYRAAMIAYDRCPACFHPLLADAAGTAGRCNECGAKWAQPRSE